MRLHINDNFILKERKSIWALIFDKLTVIERRLETVVRPQRAVKGHRSVAYQDPVKLSHRRSILF